jgi:hypothetical protein
MELHNLNPGERSRGGTLHLVNLRRASAARPVATTTGLGGDFLVRGGDPVRQPISPSASRASKYPRAAAGPFLIPRFSKAASKVGGCTRPASSGLRGNGSLCRSSPPLTPRPADRSLAATAQVMDLTLVTSAYAAADRAAGATLFFSRNLNAGGCRTCLCNQISGKTQILRAADPFLGVFRTRQLRT